MKVELNQVGKRFRRDWVLRGVNLLVEPGSRIAITGPNGSGKSTLLKMICGHLTPSKGKVNFSVDGRKIELDQVYTQLAYAAPYIELIEEFKLEGNHPKDFDPNKPLPKPQDSNSNLNKL